MPSAAFDTLKFVKTLTTHGIASEQAEGIAEAVCEVQSSSQVATKHDLDTMQFEMQRSDQELKYEINEVKHDIGDLRMEVKQEINALRAEVKQEINELRTELKQDIYELRAELKQEINELRVEVKQDIHELRVEVAGIKHEIKALESRLLIRLSAVLVLSIGAFSGFTKWLV